MRSPVRRLLVAALASSVAACSASVEIPRFCITETGLAVPGAPVAGAVTSPVFAVDIGGQIPLVRVGTTDSTLRVESVTVTPVTGNPDLSGIETATVSIQPAAGAAVDLASYQRDPAAPAPAELVLTGDDVDIDPLLVNGQANLQISLSGQPPATNWTADVTTCMRAESSVSP
jgi:hypothetical protein